MKKCLKILFILVIAAIIGLFCLHRYLECNPLHLGGGPSDPPPARCYALEFTCKKEERPPLSKETQQLYNYALYHDLHNMWREIREMMYGTD